MDLGRRPELKSDEFLMRTILVTEISRCEDLFTAEKVLHLFGALPPVYAFHGMEALQEPYISLPEVRHVSHKLNELS